MEDNSPYGPVHPKKVPTGAGNNVFDFTKRKKWDETLLAEVPASITIILSPSSNVLYTGHNHALEDILGYGDNELLDKPLKDLLTSQDWDIWQTALQEAVSNGLGSKFELFARFRRKAIDSTVPPEHVLLEIRAHLQSGDSPSKTSLDTIPFCVFAVAVPYPSEAVEQLNGFLQCKLENENLQRRLKYLKELAKQKASGSNTSSGSRNRPPRSPPGLLSNPTMVEPLQHNPTSSVGFTFAEQHPGMSSSPSTGQYAPLQDASVTSAKGLEEGSSKRSRAPQCICVTCGRTDSPEWRKGPQGPKTLCNACGLRWAKKSRKPLDKDSFDGDFADAP